MGTSIPDGVLWQAAVVSLALALVGTAMKPDSGVIGEQFCCPEPDHRCTGAETGAPADPKPSQCDDGPFGRGTGGELTYTLSVPAGGSKTVWPAVAERIRPPRRRVCMASGIGRHAWKFARRAAS